MDCKRGGGGRRKSKITRKTYRQARREMMDTEGKTEGERDGGGGGRACQMAFLPKLPWEVITCTLPP